MKDEGESPKWEPFESLCDRTSHPEFSAWCETFRGIPFKHYLDDEPGYSDDEENKVFPLKDLLRGPRDLKVSFEFWSSLVRQYLLSPNQHTPEIVAARAAGSFGVSRDVFNDCLLFYWKVVIAAWNFENDYIKECFDASIPSYPTEKPLTELPQVGLRYQPPPLRENEGFYRFKEAEFENFRENENPYTRPQQFRAWHNSISHLTLECCKGISTRYMPATVDTEQQLQYITEYLEACEPCQDAEDYQVALFTAPDLQHLHQPKFHPLHYQYPSRGKRTREGRIKNATFFTNEATWKRHLYDLKHIEQKQAPYFFEYRPSPGEILSTLIGSDHVIAPRASTSEE